MTDRQKFYKQTDNLIKAVRASKNEQTQVTTSLTATHISFFSGELDSKGRSVIGLTARIRLSYHDVIQYEIAVINDNILDIDEQQTTEENFMAIVKDWLQKTEVKEDKAEESEE